MEGIATRHGYRIEQLELSLFNLETDPGEQKNIASQHPDIVEKLSRLAESARIDLGDSLRGMQGSGHRPPGIEPPGPTQ